MRPKKVLYVLTAVLAVGVFSSCEDEDCINDLGPVVTEERELDEFKSIDFAGVGNIYLSQGEEQSVLIETNEFLLPHLDTDVSGDELKVDIDKCTGANFVLNLFITIPDIEDLTLSGVGNIYSENAWDLDDLSLTLQGCLLYTSPSPRDA